MHLLKMCHADFKLRHLCTVRIQIDLVVLVYSVCQPGEQWGHSIAER